MDSPRSWDALLDKAYREWRASATSTIVWPSSGKVFTYMKRHPETYGEVLRYVEKNAWGILSVKKRINDAIKRAAKIGGVTRVPESNYHRTGGTLYITEKVAK